MIKTPATRWFDLTTPVIGAPMAGVAGGAMARADSDGGGLGMIGVSGSHSADFVTEQCTIPADAQVPFGVGLMIWVLETRPDLFEATVAAQPSLVSVSFGDPAPYVARSTTPGSPSARRSTPPPTSTGRWTPASTCWSRRARRPGHTGRRSTLPLLQEVLTLTDRPVVAAGGIATGRGMAAALVAGAAAVWIGTPLLSCTEGLNAPCPRTDPRGERRRHRADPGVRRRGGRRLAERWPGRALVNDFSREWHGREDELRETPDARRLVVEGRRTGDPAAAPIYAGSRSGW